MVEIDTMLHGGDVGVTVSSAAADLGLTIVSDGELHKYPGSRHWHIKNGKKSGTLEVTYWPSKERLWVAYHSNRVGDGWVVDIAPRFAEKLSGGG